MGKKVVDKKKTMFHAEQVYTVNFIKNCTTCIYLFITTSKSLKNGKQSMIKTNFNCKPILSQGLHSLHE